LDGGLRVVKTNIRRKTIDHDLQSRGGETHWTRIMPEQLSTFLLRECSMIVRELLFLVK